MCTANTHTKTVDRMVARDSDISVQRECQVCILFMCVGKRPHAIGDFAGDGWVRNGLLEQNQLEMNRRGGYGKDRFLLSGHARVFSAWYRNGAIFDATFVGSRCHPIAEPHKKSVAAARPLVRDHSQRWLTLHRHPKHKATPRSVARRRADRSAPLPEAPQPPKTCHWRHDVPDRDAVLSHDAVFKLQTPSRPTNTTINTSAMVSMKSILLGVLSAALGHRALAYESDWLVVGGQLTQVSYDGEQLCGVNTAGNIFCANDNIDSKPNWRQIPGGLKWVAVWGETLWGVNSNDDVYCGRSNGTDPQWRQLPGKLKQISTDGKQICGANANNDIWCADDQITTTPNWRQLPGKLVQVDLTDGVLYGTAPDNTIWFGMSDGDPSFTQVAGGLRQIAYDGELLCGITPVNDVFCADSGLKSTPNWRQIPGKLTQLDVEAGRIYGVNGDSTIFLRWFTKPPTPTPAPVPVPVAGPVWAGWRQIDGKLRMLSYDGKTLCGISGGDDIYCATSGLDGKPNWRQVPGKLIHVVVWGDRLVGVSRANDIYVGFSSGEPRWVQIPGKLKMISYDGKQLCGANANDEIWCANDNVLVSPNWRRLPGSLKHVVVLNGVLFGVNGGDDIFTGRSVGDPKWKQVQGKLKNLEFDGNRVCGTNSADDIWCADNGLQQGAPNWQRIDGKLMYTTVNSGNLYGVSGANDIYARVDL